jgi:hypothetical protein
MYNTLIYQYKDLMREEESYWLFLARLKTKLEQSKASNLAMLRNAMQWLVKPNNTWGGGEAILDGDSGVAFTLEASIQTAFMVNW